MMVGELFMKKPVGIGGQIRGYRFQTGKGPLAVGVEGEPGDGQDQGDTDQPAGKGGRDAAAVPAPGKGVPSRQDQHRCVRGKKIPIPDGAQFHVNQG